MKFYGIKDEKTGEFVSLEGGKPVLANDRLLLEYAFGQLHGFRPSYKVEEYTEHGIGDFRGRPQKKGIYLVETNHYHPGSIVIARICERNCFMSNEKSFFVLAFWDGNYFNIDGTAYHPGNVQFWMFLETGFSFQ